jgi:hypothetical protein
MFLGGGGCPEFNSGVIGKQTKPGATYFPILAKGGREHPEPTTAEQSNVGSRSSNPTLSLEAEKPGPNFSRKDGAPGQSLIHQITKRETS